jgi:hypothetical protein
VRHSGVELDVQMPYRVAPATVALGARQTYIRQ